MASLDYWYYGQIRKYNIQFSRIFSYFKYSSGNDDSGNPILNRVPCTMAIRDKMIGMILRNNSDATTLSIPRFSYYIIEMQPNPDLRLNPTFVSNVNPNEMKINEEGKYIGEKGDSYTVSRYMPVPYIITYELDLWVSNENQKMELMEQIMVLFNPMIDLQTNRNALDWSSLTTVELLSINWSSRGIVIGNEDIELCTMQFKVPIFINPPAKVQTQKIIHTIIQTIINAETDSEFGEGTDVFYSESDSLTKIITTPNPDSVILVKDGTITLYGENNTLHDESGNIYNWNVLLELYGEFRPGISKIGLSSDSELFDNVNDIFLIVDYHPSDNNKLIFRVDETTLPSNTLISINGIINPHLVAPGIELPVASTGQRYLIIDDIGSSTDAWGTLTANKNDIIQYNGKNWFVSFDSSSSNTQYVFNSKTSKQLMWEKLKWKYTYEAVYKPGFWKLYL